MNALDDPQSLAQRVNTQLSKWIAAGGDVTIERERDALSGRRTWVCHLPNARTDIPCGGTHVHNVAELAEITVSLETRDVEGGIELIMKTNT